MCSIAAVLCYKKPDLAYQMRQQLGYKMAMIDNGSGPDLPRLNTSIHLRLEENHFFTGGWNRAMKCLGQLGYEWVWMLNSDIKGIETGTLECLDKIIPALPKGTVAISPVYNSPHRHMHVVNGAFQEVPWIDWAGPLVNTELFNRLGGFDETFVGYGCDLDFCKRAAEIGGRFYITDQVKFTHIGGMTAVSEGIGDHVDLHKMNELLHHKWGVESWTEMFP